MFFRAATDKLKETEKLSDNSRAQKRRGRLHVYSDRNHSVSTNVYKAFDDPSLGRSIVCICMIYINSFGTFLVLFSFLTVSLTEQSISKRKSYE